MKENPGCNCHLLMNKNTAESINIGGHETQSSNYEITVKH